MAFDGKVALITGAAGGLGGALVAQFRDAGARLVLLDADPRVAKLAEADASGRTFAQQTDVSSEAQVKNVVAKAAERFGRIDIVVNNAGISIRHAGGKATVAKTTLDEWNKVLAVNFTGAFLVAREVLPLMQRERWGRIVNISSSAARARSDTSSAIYSASKAALLGFARVLAAEVADSNITVNSIAPGRIETPMIQGSSSQNAATEAYVSRTPIKRLAMPDDIARAALFLASDDAAYITGAILDVNGGYFMP